MELEDDPFQNKEKRKCGFIYNGKKCNKLRQWPLSYCLRCNPREDRDILHQRQLAVIRRREFEFARRETLRKL